MFTKMEFLDNFTRFKQTGAMVPAKLRDWLQVKCETGNYTHLTQALYHHLVWNMFDGEAAVVELLNAEIEAVRERSCFHCAKCERVNFFLPHSLTSLDTKCATPWCSKVCENVEAVWGNQIYRGSINLYDPSKATISSLDDLTLGLIFKHFLPSSATATGLDIEREIEGFRFLLGVMIWLAHILRVPHRLPPQGENLVVAPVDCRVVQIKHCPAETGEMSLSYDALRITIRTKLSDTQMQMSPITGHLIDNCLCCWSFCYQILGLSSWYQVPRSWHPELGAKITVPSTCHQNLVTKILAGSWTVRSFRLGST